MEKSWYRKLFSRPQKAGLNVTPSNVDYEDAEVQFGLGLKFANANGAARDYVQAADWYRKAADQNHSLAQFNLGMMYAHGQGVTHDDDQSAMWFGRAARQGDAGAQFNLGKSCHRASFGKTPAEAVNSRIEAYKWFHLAAAQGYEGSDASTEALVLGMSREDVADGNQRVANFVVEEKIAS